MVIKGDIYYYNRMLTESHIKTQWPVLHDTGKFVSQLVLFRSYIWYVSYCKSNNKNYKQQKRVMLMTLHY